jgi:threonine synthase
LSSGLNVAELFHGPTLAFKDLSLGIVGQLINYFLEKRRKHMIILIGNLNWLI